MFGFRKKTEEKTPNVQTSEESLKTEQENVNSEIFDESVESEQIQQIKEIEQIEEYGLAKLLGKSEEGLKDEFYLFQLKKLMKLIGRTLTEQEYSSSALDLAFASAVKFGYDCIAVSPCMTGIAATKKSKIRAEELKIAALIDFPKGEELLKSKIFGIKECLRTGADFAFASLPSAYIGLQKTHDFKAQAVKLSKSARKPVVPCIDADALGAERTLKAVRLIGDRGGSVALKTEKFSDGELKKLIKEVKRILPDGTETVIFCLADRAETLAEILELKVQKVFTPFADKIAQELYEKFNLN